MFAQVIKGKVKDKDALRAAMDAWQRNIRPGAQGFLGSTAGAADDGTFVATARFESQAAAQANSDRPEQSEWWQSTSANFDGEPTFYNCNEVELFQGGGSDDAGFVQVMIYKPKDVSQLKGMTAEFEKMTDLRPDLLGGFTAFADDGTVIETNYFTSEAEAREGEKKELPAEMQEMMQSFGENAGEVEFVDLRDPWLH